MTAPAGRLTASAGLLVAASAVLLGQSVRRTDPFTELRTTGVSFEHENGASGGLTLAEITGSGGALVDYDNDGDLDLYVVQGGPIPIGETRGRASATPGDRLFRNDLDATGRLTFRDVTVASGIDATGYGMCAATGDIDNDGWTDLYVTNLGSNQLFRNNGDGTFSDLTAERGADDERWSASAAFLDYDRDGWLDLYVTSYVDLGPDPERECFSRGSARDYCNPEVYDPVPDRLLRNNGNGSFTDVSGPAGIDQVAAAGLGVVTADVDGDGWTDVYVANDGDPNILWMNGQDDGRFRDGALLAGVALNRAGQPEGGMGVDAEDIDDDGDADLFVTNLDNETSTLYVNLGNGYFDDRTIQAGLLQPSFGQTGFGTRFLDYDGDGRLDLFTVNGAVRHLLAQVQAGDPYPLKQANQLFRRETNGRFLPAESEPFAARDVSRGAAVGDLDNDGDPDLVVFNNRGPLQILRNTLDGRAHWLGLRIVEAGSGRDSLQARVELVDTEGGSRWRRVHADGSYCSASDPRILFGLGASAAPRTVRIHWPDGAVEEHRNLDVDRYWMVVRGEEPRPS